VGGHHDPVCLVLAHPELSLEHAHHEFARREVVVEQHDLVERRPRGLGLAASFGRGIGH
jgi:hypothetical protein